MNSIDKDNNLNNEEVSSDEEIDENDNTFAIENDDLYADYFPRKCKLGLKHPDPVVESASLSSVEPPDVWYELSLPAETIASGALSALQLESITYAAQQHERLNPDGSRAGFLIGDGAGVGKGRMVAGVIFENYLKGRKKSIWISVSSDLKYDAERDLKDIGAQRIKVITLNELKYGTIDLTRGVIFSTYSALIGETSKKISCNSRLKQLIEWCRKDFDGVIIFDECHRAKNLCPVGGTKPTKTAVNVLELQNQLPKARVVYASATGASEPRNMAYMVRLGMWGEGLIYPEFKDFNNAVEKRGVGAMEIVAMDMKRKGMYIARQLSFKGVMFKTEEVFLTKEFVQIYDDCVRWWIITREKFLEASNLVYTDKRKKTTFNTQFWAAHQRFFKYLCIASKVHQTVQITKDAIKNGKCVVICLQSTGESGTLDQLEKEKGKLRNFVSITKFVMQSLIENHFPASDDVALDEIDLLLENMTIDQKDESTSSPSKNADKTKNSAKDRAKLLYNMKQELLKQITNLEERLPPNTLDQLIDELGGPTNVAEMTGRKGRVVRTSAGFQYQLRSKDDVGLEGLNITEKKRFMNGDKLCAIISEAASTGISLQSSRREINHRRRVHITLELPWSADRAIQQFGRTHRSDQVNAPEYIFLISDLAGERRFASVVAKRLECLGALTHGDRRAADSRDLSKFNFDNKYGRLALKDTMRAVLGTGKPIIPPPLDYEEDFFKDVNRALMDVGLITASNVLDKDSENINKFLNRILGVPVNLQNKLFEYFLDTLHVHIARAKRSGEFDLGILDLGFTGDCPKQVELHTFLHKHIDGVTRTQLHVVQVDRGLSWDEAYDKYSELTGSEEGFYLSTKDHNNKRIAILIIAATNNLYQIYRPNTGKQSKKTPLTDITNKYEQVLASQAEKHWTRQYINSEKTCHHAYRKGNCKLTKSGIECEFGLRKITYYVVSGSILDIWKRMEIIFAKIGYLSKTRVVRLKITECDKIMGTLVPKKCVEPLKEALKSDAKETTANIFV